MMKLEVEEAVAVLHSCQVLVEEEEYSTQALVVEVEVLLNPWAEEEEGEERCS